MNNVSSIKIRLSYATLCDLSLLIYFCVMFAHQQETTLDTLLRYGSLLFVIAAHVFADPPVTKSRNGNIILLIGKFEIWLLVLMIYGALSMCWSINSANAYNVLFNLTKILLVCFSIFPRLNNKENMNRVLLLLLVSLLYMVIMLIIRTPISVWGTERIGDVIGQNPNEIGRLMCLGSLLAFYFLSLLKQHRLLLIGFIGIFSLGAFMTGSKNAVFILIFQLGIYYFLISGNWKRILVIVGVLLAMIVIYQLIMTNDVLYALVGIRLERMLNLFTKEGRVDGSTLERLYFIHTAWELFKSHPVLGIGLNNFSAYLASIYYRNPVYSHCGFLELLSTLGIVGFSIYYSMYVRVLSGLFYPSVRRNKLAAMLFVLNLRVLLFDVSSISLYTYNSYITLLLAFCYLKVLKSGSDIETHNMSYVDGV